MRSQIVVIAPIFLAACGNLFGAGGGDDMHIETIRPEGLLGSPHTVTLESHEAHTVVSPVILADGTGGGNPHYANYCSPLSPEAVEAAAAASAMSGSLEIAMPSGVTGGGSASYQQANTRVVIPRPWNKTQGAVMFESFRFALCEAWRNHMLDDWVEQQKAGMQQSSMAVAAKPTQSTGEPGQLAAAPPANFLDLLYGAYKLALASADKEIDTPAWKERNQHVTLDYAPPNPPTLSMGKNPPDEAAENAEEELKKKKEDEAKKAEQAKKPGEKKPDEGEKKG